VSQGQYVALAYGAGLAAWHEALGGRVRDVVEARRASPAVFTRYTAPFVLAYMAPSARERWRQAANECFLTEWEHFVFVA
jgi:hypothetical protein